jgi:hypothetical protein
MKQISEFEREAQRKNTLFGIVLVIAFVAIVVLIGMVGLPVRCGPIPPP